MSKNEMDAITQFHYDKGYSAFKNGLPFSACPHGLGQMGAMCAWKGGWHDALTESGESYADYLRSRI